MEGPNFDGSELIVNPALDLFIVPPTDFGVIRSDYQQLLPTNQVKGREIPISFRIDKSLSGFLDLRDSFLYIRASIKHNDGSDLLETDSRSGKSISAHHVSER